MNADLSSPSQITALDLFAEKLLQERGAKDLEPEVKQQMVDDLVERMEERINALILQKMPPEKLEEFEQVVNTGSTENILEYCAKTIPDLEQYLATELALFRTTYLTTG